MWMRMMLFYNVACIGTPLVKYRVHPTSASSSWGDGTSIKNFKEHYLAAIIIFDNYSEHIPQSNSLKRKISLAFAERSIKMSRNAFAIGKYATGKMFFNEAVRISPQILKNPASWMTVGGLAIGPIGIRLYQSLKKALGKQQP
jgi:hypothetical protein